ncbi:MAG: folate family ECF transporter S component [Ruminococcus sp.]|nr:folate family ECF transporter S component [Ruminococcus sp.]
MKSFFSLFSDSSKELKKVSTITVAGMLMALSIVLRSLAINITVDLRITFSFLPLMAIALIYGPSVCILATVGSDVIGYFLDGYKARDYNFGLLAVKIIIAIIYGIILYKKATGKQIIIFGAIARIIAVIIGNLILNSAVMYFCYYNPNFPFMSSSEWQAFWIWFSPRLIKNLGLLPIEIVLISVALPAINQAYHLVFDKRKTA